MKKNNPAFSKACKKLDIDSSLIPPVMSFEDACRILKRKPVLPKVAGIPKRHQGYIIADYKLITIIEAINTDVATGKIWTPDFRRSSPLHYEPWFHIKASDKVPSGSGFSRADFGRWCAVTGAGSRLCFRDIERWKFAVHVHTKLFVERTLILNP